MWEKIAEKLGDWAIATISALPPSQNLVAFFIVLALSLPILSAGVKLFRSHTPTPTPAPVSAPTEIAPDSLWIVTILTGLTTIGVQTQEIQRDVDGIERALGHISSEMSTMRGELSGLVKLVRGRSNKNRRRPLNQG